MDISTPIIFVGIFIIACVSLFLVFKFGIKEKSYEEAVAEQRQQTNALLGVRAKPKEKKNKKSSKKPKDKSPENEGDEIVETTTKHVGFKEKPEILNLPKETSSVKKEEIVKPEVTKEKVTKEKKITNLESEPVKAKKEKIKQPAPVIEKIENPIVKTVVEKKIEEQKVEKTEVTPVAPPSLAVNTAKEKKKKKSEFNTLQQLTAERDGLLTLVRKAELSRLEIQTLIELLLNKQHEAPSVIEDWSEGKSDPIQKLKKQLAEKEKLLTEAVDGQIALQARIREIRGEVQAEKIQQNQKIKSLEELLHAKNIEIESGNNRNQSLQHQLQQLQVKFNDDLQKLVEENNVLVHQKQQLEGRLSQGQEAENIVIQLRGEMQNAQMEIHRLNCEFAKVANDSQNFQMESEQVKIINKQLEETRQGLESQINNLLKKDEELKKEISHLTTTMNQQVEENRKNEHTIVQLRNETKQLKTEKNDINNIIAQLNEDLKHVRAERDQMEIQNVNGSAQENEKYQLELSNINNKLSSVQAQLQQTLTQLDETNSKNKTLLVEIEEQKAKNNEIKKEICMKEQDSQKQFIQRLFPEVEELKSVSAKENWQSEFEKLITQHIKSIKSVNESQRDASEENLLKMQVTNYKSIIDETESQLIRLQNNIAQEETRWRDSLAQKNAEIERLKEQAATQEKTKLEYEAKLRQEKQLNETLSKECQQLNRVSGADSTATIEKLTEEVNRLSELLRLEQTNKSGSLNGSPKEQNFKSTNGMAVMEGSTGN